MKVYAHRGFSGSYPENTMLAFKKAAETGCYGIELDVQLTKDGEIVVIHDEKIDRTTNGTGYVKDFTLAELKKFDASKLFPNQFKGISVPSFAEYCEWVKTTPLVTNIEIKTGVYYYENIEEKTIAMLKKYGLEKQVIFSSFNHLSLTEEETLAPSIKRGALVENPGIGNPGFYCKKHNFAFYHPDFNAVTPEVVENCNKHGVGINAWTINTMDALEKACRWNIEGVISNYPDICQKYIEKR